MVSINKFSINVVYTAYLSSKEDDPCAEAIGAQINKDNSNIPTTLHCDRRELLLILNLHSHLAHQWFKSRKRPLLTDETI